MSHDPLAINTLGMLRGSALGITALGFIVAQTVPFEASEDRTSGGEVVSRDVTGNAPPREVCGEASVRVACGAHSSRDASAPAEVRAKGSTLLEREGGVAQSRIASTAGNDRTADSIRSRR